MRKKAKKLLKDNPDMDYSKFRQLTGLSLPVYYEIKKELGLIRYKGKPKPTKDDEISKEWVSRSEKLKIREELKRKLKAEMLKKMKENGYVNLKGTPFEKEQK
jgi:hypothetical protein